MSIRSACWALRILNSHDPIPAVHEHPFSEVHEPRVRHPGHRQRWTRCMIQQAPRLAVDRCRARVHLRVGSAFENGRSPCCLPPGSMAGPGWKHDCVVKGRPTATAALLTFSFMRRTTATGAKQPMATTQRPFMAALLDPAEPGGQLRMAAEHLTSTSSSIEAEIAMTYWVAREGRFQRHQM